MKTRRIYLQPGECVEVINAYGTSILKVTARFKGAQPCAVIYEQPDILTLNPIGANESKVSLEPEGITPDLIEQNNLNL